MRALLNQDGQVTIPAEALELAGLTPGEELELDVRDGRIELTPASAQVRLEIRDGWPVLIAPEGTPPLTIEDVNSIVDRIRSGERD